MDLMARAVQHHRAGRLDEAATAYMNVLRQQPDNADALNLLGLVTHRLGHGEEALVLMERAVQADPELAPAWANRGLVLRGLGRLDDARDSVLHALKLRPNFPEASLNLARIEHARGAIDPALSAARHAFRGRPDSAQAAAVLGVTLIAAGRSEEATPMLRIAAEAGDSGAAEALARLLLASGAPREAAAAFAAALRASPGDRRYAVALADALAATLDPPNDLGEALLIALGHDGVDHSRLDRAIRAQVAALEHEPDALIALPLLVPWLSRLTVRGPRWEAALSHTRGVLLDRVLRGGEPPLDVLMAFGIHGFHSEYVWDTSPPERAALVSLDPARPDHAAAAAMYGRLHSYWHRQDWVTGPLAPLVRATLHTRAVEATLGVTIASVTEDDPTSGPVRALYEAHPYPRIVGVQVRQPRSLHAALSGVLPDVSGVPKRPVDVLVAGGGTGQHPLTSASAWHCNVVAIDLSRAALSRATRVAQALGIDNIQFARADLLQLGIMERTFDVVEAVGVLHHLEDPLAGWRSLVRRVRPGGLMRIGLYARRGRAEVVAAREVIARQGLPDTEEGIRAARQRLLGLPEDHPARPIVWSPDFSSVTGCRDLLFHVREHTYTLPRLAAELDELSLRFLGFQHADPSVPAAYHDRWPHDLDQLDLSRWEELEADAPRCFSGMYVFWVATSRHPS